MRRPRSPSRRAAGLTALLGAALGVPVTPAEAAGATLPVNAAGSPP
ncbi:hypothetical protein [Microbispora corallina]|nr:hypothetical protein [Microbispora corallina]